MHLEAVAGAHIRRPAHAADGVQLVRIDRITVEQRHQHMEAQDLAEHKDAAAGPVV
ncbi:MAG: hypothetical protein ABSG10_06995 [Terracidiphilus sp.]|jgi:hypothetical protein